MNVKILKGVAGVGFSYAPGDVVVDMPPKIAKDLVEAGYAVELKSKPGKKSK